MREISRRTLLGFHMPERTEGFLWKLHRRTEEKLRSALKKNEKGGW